MNSTQLFDAFENILHIRMPKDEFEVLFKKVKKKKYTAF